MTHLLSLSHDDAVLTTPRLVSFLRGHYVSRFLGMSHHIRGERAHDKETSVGVELKNGAEGPLPAHAARGLKWCLVQIVHGVVAGERG